MIKTYILLYENKMEYPGITVVIAAYNSEKYLLKAIDSVLQQSYDNFELIVVDDGSTDNTRSAVKQLIEENTLAKFKYIYQAHSGISRARNEGIERSGKEIIVVLDSDDEHLPDTLATIASFFKDNPETDLMYGDINIIDREGRYIRKKKYRSYGNDELKRKIFRSVFVPFKHSAIAYKRDSVVKIGLYNSEYKRLVDIDLMLRFINDNRKVTHIDKLLTNFRRHEANVTNNRIVQQKFWFKLIKENYPNKLTRFSLNINRSLVEISKYFFNFLVKY